MFTLLVQYVGDDEASYVDEFERYDREARRENGTYTIDDYLDDREEERRRDTSRMI